MAIEYSLKYRNRDGMTTEQRLKKSRIKLLTLYPFFGTLALYLSLEEDRSIDTAATDGNKYYYNPDFIDSLNDAQVNWITCHEVLHPALGHLWRKGSRVHQRWNVAADYAIHCIMKEMADKHPKDFQMPDKILYDAKYNDMSSEEIYEKLTDDGVSKLTIVANGQATIDSHDKWGDGQESEKDKEKNEREWQARVQSAAEQAGGVDKGDMPAGIKRLINSLKEPQKNWRELLAEFVQFEVHDYAFTPPDRRLYGLSDLLGEIMLPDYSDETTVVKELIFAIDTSGSINDQMLSVFISEGVGMLNQFSRNITGKVLYADADVAAIYDLNDIDAKAPKGGGGTSFVPVFDWVEKYQRDNNVEVSGVVYLTDCYGDFPKQAPSYPVLWVSTTPLKDLPETYTPPFGVLTEITI